MRTKLGPFNLNHSLQILEDFISRKVSASFKLPSCTVPNMNDEINVQFKLETFKSDSEKMQRILKDMETYQTTTSDKEEAVEQWKEEFQRRLREAGLTVS